MGPRDIVFNSCCNLTKRLKPIRSHCPLSGSTLVYQFSRTARIPTDTESTVSFLSEREVDEEKERAGEYTANKLLEQI